MANAASNEFKEELLKGTIDFDGDTFKIILMQSGFSFNATNHSTYSDVSGSELATASGYTAGGNTLSGVSVTKDDANSKGTVTWSNSSWTASGGDLTASGAIVYDDTPASPADPVIYYIDFGGDQTVTDGGTFTVANLQIDLS